MQTETTNEHRWLQKLVGKWMAEGEGGDGAGHPAEVEDSEQVGARGRRLWVQGRSEGEMPGCGHAVTVMTLGYDPTRKHFVGTFIGSMMTHMWVYARATSRPMAAR